MNVLVTGSSGRIGRAIYVALTRKGVQVRGFDRHPSSTADIVGDLLSPVLRRDALAGVDAVIHVAALHAPHVGHLPDAEFQRSNVDGTRALLEAAAAAGLRRIVFTSTTALYGAAATPTGRAGWVDETLTPIPRTIYHHSKLAAEQLLIEAAGQGGPSVRILRMSRCFPEAADRMAVHRLHRGIDARDVAAAHIAALADTDDAAAATCLISAATPFRREDAQALWDNAPPVIAERAPALAAAFAARGWALPPRIDRVYDAARAVAKLGWRPRHGFDEVLAQYDAESPEVLMPDAARGNAED
ncbi:MAG: epimerase [Lysobacterales bacterium 69-70]|nr:NAD(P)-dependent oxidoreductase [Xanthomonadaceae bacterium]ODU34883.1 MAG: epimerase [Xanthomonadaceae bacterium SCN 69-320]ODV19774.1 MAG: epimerase [Xanthomonadaceae bacterium SCN 69-25]OJY95135.1 MAG: epimerase [Xanthomonadales bacterium 69-70]